MKGINEMTNKIKTIHAYGTFSDGRVFDLGDVVDMALRANMMVNDCKKALIKANPQLVIEFKVEFK
jgi:hypothetical protein